MIKVSNLKKSFQSNHVLNDISFTVEKGNIFALLGSNGAGKTTMIKIFATLLKPDSGTVTINGFDVVTQENDVRNCISLTGQFVAVDEVLTGRENLKLIGQLKGLQNVENKVEEWLAFFKLTDVGNQKVATYSGGMHRRLDIAMSLIGNPQVLFLDEPTTGLDPQNRIAMWDLVKDLSKNGITIFLTTQYLEEAEYLADKIAILHDAELVVEGTAQKIKEVIPQRGAQLNFKSMEQATVALEILSERDIVVDSVEQKLPSLESVFLAIVAEEKEEHHE